MPRNRSKIRNWIEYIAFRGIIDFIGLFSIKTSMKIGELFGKLCLRIFPRLKRTGIRNLELALPELSKTEHKRIGDYSK
jgi:lauroyl/myristoyl acyltransferase